MFDVSHSTQFGFRHSQLTFNLPNLQLAFLNAAQLTLRCDFTLLQNAPTAAVLLAPHRTTVAAAVGCVDLDGRELFAGEHD